MQISPQSCFWCCCNCFTANTIDTWWFIEVADCAVHTGWHCAVLYSVYIINSNNVNLNLLYLVRTVQNRNKKIRGGNMNSPTPSIPIPPTFTASTPTPALEDSTPALDLCTTTPSIRRPRTGRNGRPNRNAELCACTGMESTSLANNLHRTSIIVIISCGPRQLSNGVKHTTRRVTVSQLSTAATRSTGSPVYFCLALYLPPITAQTREDCIYDYRSIYCMLTCLLIHQRWRQPNCSLVQVDPSPHIVNRGLTRW